MARAQGPRRAIVAPIMALLVTAGTDGATRNARSGDPELEEALNRARRVAKLYRDEALRFTCREQIEYVAEGRRRGYRFSYIYAFDDLGRLHDYRLSTRKSDAKAPAGVEGDDPLDRVKVPELLLRAYSWMFLFEDRRTPFYRYELAGRDEVEGRRAIGIRFEPIPPYQEQVNDWFGTAWFDAESWQPLRVDAIHAADYLERERFRDSLQTAPEQNRNYRTRHVFARFSTDFGVEKNGMRFPSEVVIRRSRYEVWGGRGQSGYQEYPIHSIRQRYKDYRFFGVRTAEEIDRIVSQDDPS